ncbi:glutamine-tRNA ligase [Blastomyces percursus]|uniref:glutamine--tRNA ligase n=1 Tax=Blastomyces percursus TaxID=1658174 RepID=A0A1J9QDI2_9EURO|nr:glutamine-tRNA ligase [Blastomyces percursus]
MDAPVDLPDRTKAPGNAQKPRKEKAPKAPKPPKAKKPTAIAFNEDPDSMFKTGFLADVYNERPIGSEYVKKVVTRFPPEPNGYLHIGHSKAIAINFGFARFYGGDCYLRFDDTNPKSEEEKYFIAIEDIVRWLGFSPVKVTYSSDNFDRLYELAEDLIRRDGAYVCHCNKAEIQAQRGGGEGEGKPRFACAHRTRPIEESLAEFRAMRDGKYAAGEAALRMKQDLDDGNPQMWDLFAYRVIDDKERHHFRTGDKWRIYPTYDFTHCLCDSFEGVTHSLCTTEFEQSRVSYEWLCDKLEVYKPMQREYGRLNVTGTILSKRDIMKLIDGGHVGGYDDPRLYTIVGLRRRGVPPGAILSFVNELGVTKAKTNIQVHRFEQSVRRYLETTVPRLMVVMEPLKVIIDDLPEDYLEMVELPYSKDPAFGVHKVPFTRTVYIERADFREVDSPDYFRLAPGKTVGLMKVPYPITATSFEKDPETGLVNCVHAKYEKPKEGSAPKKPKTFIHWVALSPEHSSPIKAEVHVINRLFNSEDPKSHPDGFLADINSESMEIYRDAMIDIGFPEIKSRAPWPAKEGEKLSNPEKPETEEYDISGAGGIGADGSIVHPETVRFQGMRVAYFALDSDSTEDKVILNRIVALKDDAGK